ncbi:MAG: hypothetical protein M1820_000384 [Bogoriella megaspora]|nr:MAG: hypothetical protein M1820_000384 [Bogoriella megaspora]
MARGNQREKAREKNQKAEAAKKKSNSMSGTEYARTKEDTAAIMRAKQAAAEQKKAEAKPPPTPPKLPMPAMDGNGLEPHKHWQVHVAPLGPTPVPVAMLPELLALADAVAEITAMVYVVNICVADATCAMALEFDCTAKANALELFDADETAI